MSSRSSSETKLYEVVMWILVGPAVFGAIVAVITAGLAGFGQNAAAWAQAIASIVLIGIAITVPWYVHRMEARERARASRNRARTVAMKALPVFRHHWHKLVYVSMSRFLDDIEIEKGTAWAFRSEADAEAFRQSRPSCASAQLGLAPIPRPFRTHIHQLAERSVVSNDLSELRVELGLLDAAAFASQRAFGSASTLSSEYQRVFTKGLMSHAISVEEVRESFGRVANRAAVARDQFKEAIVAMEDLMERP